MFAPFSFLWGAICFCKNFLYDRGYLSSKRVDCPVVSVGNIVAGGAGKTPFVHLLASHFPSKKVAILSRGYGKVADEALLLAKRLKHAKIYVGKDRVASAKKAVLEGADLIILDDGFQYRKLHRDFDLVLLSSSDPFGKGHYLPWGFLRDSPHRLKKADSIFVTGRWQYSLPFDATSLSVEVSRILDAQGVDRGPIRGWKVALFSGIAKPELFRKTVEDLGAEVILDWRLADHAAPGAQSLADFVKKALQAGAQAVLCTEKDFVKLPCQDPSILYVEIALRVESRKGAWENLIAKIEQKIDNCVYGK